MSEIYVCTSSTGAGQQGRYGHGGRALPLRVRDRCGRWLVGQYDSGFEVWVSVRLVTGDLWGAPLYAFVTGMAAGVRLRSLNLL